LEKELVETYGPVDSSYLSDEELKVFTNFQPGSDVNPFRDDWVVEPLLWAQKKRFPKVVNGLNNLMNWDAFLNNKGLVRFRIETANPREVIKTHLATNLDILKYNNRVITFKRNGKPSVRVVRSLDSQNGKAVIVELNPFAPKLKILDAVIQTLNPDETTFTRKDLFDPEKRRALKLWKEGKTFREIAYTFWPDEVEEEDARIDSLKSQNKALKLRCEEYAINLLYSGKEKLWKEAFRKAKKQFKIKGKFPVNSYLLKVYRLIS
jgi:hypothetical protein